MAVTLTVNTDHTASLSSRYLARQGEVGALMTVTVPAAVYALGTYAYIDFTDADGVASYLGDYDASSGTFVVSVGAADNILAKDGIVKIQFVLRDNLISESYTAVWKSQIVEAIIERSVNADTYAIPAAMPSDDPPETYEASRVSIEDVGTYYASNNVEDALQEAAVDIASNTADIADIESVNGIVKGDGAGTYAAATEADIPRAGGATYPFTTMPYVGAVPIVGVGTGYVKLAGGIMMAWGAEDSSGFTQDGSMPAGTYIKTITFPVAFSAAPVVMCSSLMSDGFPNHNVKSTSAAQAILMTNVKSALRYITWLAIGTFA